MRMPVRSLTHQLLASVGLLLILFFGVMTLTLDLAFRDLSERNLRDRLDVQVLALIAASDEQASGGLQPQQQLVEARFNNPNSGLYGEITLHDGRYSWRSTSMLGTGLDFRSHVRPGQREFGQRLLTDGSRVMALSVGLAWEFSDGATEDVTFNVAENLQPYYAQLKRFRAQLFAGFGVLGALLVGALSYLLQRGLRPLRRIEQEIGAIEAGRQAELGEGYPRELAGVTANMNALLQSERERLQRYRNTLGNLAHSLKTPLAVMRNVLNLPELRQQPTARQLDEQVGRMDDIVRYQLKRAAASAGTALGAARIPVREWVGPLRDTLLKVYAERDIQCDLDIADDCRFAGDKGDLMEIAGNLLDNAFKWCRGRVKMTVHNFVVTGARREGLQIVVEDDGPGIVADKRRQVLERGARLDERVAGQGIGLSVVREIAELHRGSVDIGSSELGGARITVRLLEA